MFYSNRNNLFRQNDISSYLRACSESIEQEIKNLTLEKINSKGESELIKELTEEHTIHAPTLKEDEIKIDAQEGEVEVYNQHHFHDEPRTYRTTGLKINVQVPFDGNPKLFNCRASTFSFSGTPEGRVQGQNLFFCYETAEKDPEKIKSLWRNDIRDIKQNLEWINKDVTAYNSSLKNNIRALVAQRKKEAEGNQSLIDKIKS